MTVDLTEYKLTKPLILNAIEQYLTRMNWHDTISNVALLGYKVIAVACFFLEAHPEYKTEVEELIVKLKIFYKCDRIDGYDK